jgi:hypothetical protein
MDWTVRGSNVVSDVGLWPLACWDCGFASRRGKVICVVCCTVRTKRKSRDSQDKEVRIKVHTERERDRQTDKRIPSGGEIFRTRPDRSCGPPSLLYNGYRVSFPCSEVGYIYIYEITRAYTVGTTKSTKPLAACSCNMNTCNSVYIESTS